MKPASIIAAFLANKLSDEDWNGDDCSALYAGDAEKLIAILADFGYVIVPREPTKVMREVCRAEDVSSDIWRAMIDAELAEPGATSPGGTR